MNKNWILKKLLILAIIFLSKFSVNSQTGIEIFSNKLASQYLGNRPGALVIGVYNNGVQQIFYYGETELHNGKKPDSTSVFELGSLTETFTSLLYADQVIKGKIHEDDKLSNFLPVDVPAPVYQHVICEPYKTETGLYDNGSGDNMQLKFTPNRILQLNLSQYCYVICRHIPVDFRTNRSIFIRKKSRIPMQIIQRKTCMSF